MTLLKRFQKVNSLESSILKDLSEKVSILYPNIEGVSNPCNCREKGITNKDFLSTFGKMIKNKTLKEVHNYFIEILGFDEKSSDAALNNKYKTRGSAHWACIAHLTIEWYWSKFQREIIITLKNSSHLAWRVGLSDTILKGTHPGTIYAKFGSIWPSCFRGEDFFNISQSEKRIILGGHVYRPNGTKWRNFIEDLT